MKVAGQGGFERAKLGPFQIAKPSLGPRRPIVATLCSFHASSARYVNSDFQILHLSILPFSLVTFMPCSC